ncbi:MAG: GrpB family protein [Bacteroidota bacterium]
MFIRLDDLTPGELGRLFPIIISEPDSDWPKLFHQEEFIIRKALGETNISRIEHIGSTAVPHLKAKPTIDILLEVPGDTDKDFIIKKLAKLDYHYICRPENPAPHMMLVKGYTIEGFQGQTYHVHVRFPGDWDELYFRDYLKAHPDIAKEYGNLKVQLSEEYRNDRDGYTDKKTDFIKRITGIARTEKEIIEMVNRETKAWDTQDINLLITLFHPDMVWPWPRTPQSHDPLDWELPLGKFNKERWSKGWQDLFDQYTLVHNKREIRKIEISAEQDGAFAVVDIDTLWIDKDNKKNHWKGRVCKVYSKVSGEWKMTMHTGVLDYEN